MSDGYWQTIASHPATGLHYEEWTPDRGRAVIARIKDRNDNVVLANSPHFAWKVWSALYREFCITMEGK